MLALACLHQIACLSNYFSFPFQLLSPPPSSAFLPPPHFTIIGFYCLTPASMLVPTTATTQSYSIKSTTTKGTSISPSSAFLTFPPPTSSSALLASTILSSCGRTKLHFFHSFSTSNFNPTAHYWQHSTTHWKDTLFPLIGKNLVFPMQNP